jgi:hypothetical protein
VLIALGAGEIAHRVNWIEQVDQAQVALDAELVDSQISSQECAAKWFGLRRPLLSAP